MQDNFRSLLIEIPDTHELKQGLHPKYSINILTSSGIFKVMGEG